MPKKLVEVRRTPMPNGVYRIVSLIDGWKEVVTYTAPRKAKKGKQK